MKMPMPKERSFKFIKPGDLGTPGTKRLFSVVETKEGGTGTSWAYSDFILVGTLAGFPPEQLFGVGIKFNNPQHHDLVKVLGTQMVKNDVPDQPDVEEPNDPIGSTLVLGKGSGDFVAILLESAKGFAKRNPDGVQTGGK